MMDFTSTGWCRSSNRSTALILEIEQEIAACNRRLLYVPGVTILSLDDDHLRMASRAVVNLTSLAQNNNPKKGLGPVGNALCSALHPVFFACHFTRVGEKVLDVWQRLIQLLQGAATTGSLQPMTDSIVAADRGYNNSEVLEFLSNDMGMNLLGTHKRDLWYPFVFGDGKIRARHKGMVVSESGCRAVYNARLKDKGSIKHGKQVEAVLYRESCSGRIAALIVNNPGLFRARGFTIVPHERFRGEGTRLEDITDLQTVFDATQGNEAADADMTDVNLTFDEEPSEMQSGQISVEQVLNSVSILTFYQSEDPVWFLLRAFKFTSRTGHGFIQAIASNYDANIEALGQLLCGRSVAPLTSPLPEDRESAAPLVGCFRTVCDLLGIQKRQAPMNVDSNTLKDRILGMSRSRIQSERLENLQATLEKFGRVPTVEGRLLKRDLVAAYITMQNDLRSGSLEVQESEASPELGIEDKVAYLENKLREASLNAWVLKPLVATTGMKEGSINEVYVLKGLPSFMKGVSSTYCKGSAGDSGLDANGYHFVQSKKLNITYIRTTGLVVNKLSDMLADSPDAVCAARKENGDLLNFACEVKTMTAIGTIESSKQTAAEFGTFSIISGIGADMRSNELFRKLVPSPAYRTQCIHHAVVLGVRHVMYVVGKGGRAAAGGIIYCTLLNFSSPLKNYYSWCLDAIREASFRWVGLKSEHIPKGYDDLLRQSHASDLHSFSSYYNLSLGVASLIEERGLPLPPARRVRLTPAVFWNQLKGGVDIVSRILKTLARSNISENPVVSIIARLLTMQVNNGAVIYWLSVAKERGMLLEDESSQKRGYSQARHAVTEVDTFGKFARRLAREWLELNERNERSADQINGNRTIKPMFARNAYDRYNYGAAKLRRLNRSLNHDVVTAQRAYCVLCAWTLTIKIHNKAKSRKGGSHMNQWCSVCKEPICDKCWGSWHSTDVLKRK